MINKMNELNRELVLDELSNFEHRKNGEIPVILERYLESIAQNGDTLFSWTKLQPLLRRKLELVMNEFHQLCPTDHLMPLPNVRPFDFEEMKQQILQAIDSFCSAPFTIQRLCELMTNPSKHYKRTDKFMRGIEKNILVVTTIEPKASDGSTIQYTTSSFKNLFSSLHSASHANQMSLSSSPSTSLLVNGITDVICDQQMALHCGNESSVHSLSSQMSINSSLNSANSHLAPLQQLDSFTTVFATNPSTPLSVVSDLHYSQHSSSLSLMTHVSPDDTHLTSTASSHKMGDISSSADLESPIISSSSSILTSTSININSQVKDEPKASISSEPNEPTPSESNETTSVAEVSESSQIIDSEVANKESEATTPDKTSEDIKSDESENNSNVTSSENSNDSNDKTDDSSNVSIAGEAPTLTPTISEESKSLTVESDNESQTYQTIKTIETPKVSENRGTNEEEISQPMEFGNNAPNDNSDMTDCSDKNSDSNPMDETLSQSDQSEPMDED